MAQGSILRHSPRKPLAPLSAIPVPGAKPSPQKVSCLADQAEQGMDALPAPFLSETAAESSIFND